MSNSDYQVYKCENLYCCFLLTIVGADVKDQDINLDLGLLKDPSAWWMKL